MRVDQAIYRLLAADTAVRAIVGTHIYAGVLSQNSEYPAIAYRIAGGESVVSLDASNGLRRSDVRVFCCTKPTSYAIAADLAEAVRLALADYRGEVSDGASPPSTIEIQNIFTNSPIDAFDDRTQTWQVIRDFEVWSHEQVPVHI